MTFKNKWLIGSLASLALVSVSSASHAACEFQPRDNADSYLGSLDAVVAEGCFGGNADATAITASILRGLASINDDPQDGNELRSSSSTLVDLLNEIDGSLTGAIGEAPSSWRSYYSITLNELDIARDQVASNASTIPAAYWQRHSDYGFFEGKVTGEYLISYGNDIRQACPDDEYDVDCQAALKSIGTLTRHIALVRRVLANPVRQRLGELHTQIKTLDAEWNYYFDDARSQFWWEFLANNALYDPPENQLSAPPNAQLILLHPSAAVEYVGGDATVEESYNLVGLVELIGYNRLRWKEGRPYSKWPLGASLVATFVPAAQGDEFGYGVMIHIKNNYSFGATRRDTGSGDETTWMFSVDLNKLFLEKSKDARRLFHRGE